MKAILALEDGTIFKGKSFTGNGEASGEVIFNTGMTGYQEILTDPSYTGQMVTMTYPLIGNYGVNPEDVESHKVQVGGFIVKECCKNPSNWRSTIPLPEYLTEIGVMGIEGIDTRALTRHLRIHGAQRGYMATGDVDPAELVKKAQSIENMEGLNLADRVSCEKPYIWNGKDREFIDDLKNFSWKGTGPKLAVYDFGIKWNILRLMAAEGFDMLVVPSHFTAAQIRELGPDAIFLSNGPGDPAAVTTAVEATKDLYEDFPIAGICLGHQILGLAMGGKTFKLKFGHHGCNHPVMDLGTEKIEISSQNHGFCVDIEGLNFLEPTHINLNDKTLEGFRHKEKPLLAIQHHPEAGPGPHDSQYFFARFREMVKEATGK
ncbi:glutamine-hydrolyzing carbamoyl-phosphate synthase small subunit [Pseudodesulfovibrio sp. zrk46]|uniref:glutamine-hydrolyzing carbamoyl-phosphate synthase small subunit n=1 Tax=Pseudodesulfovibrio sp. zrk46 TaxID=2725288 RepID=UPI001448BE87|nr:glutamine-hydrolyzing carbamoyl-phosphate synthase small subunit [Pseudodesulfovibrio sp. zrk46]QJB58536.1 glutamine-hydrolyzing carbamoyl-phosphate synthase small subunit [Pseudodesulfovibrio sp. zrk46]